MVYWPWYTGHGILAMVYYRYTVYRLTNYGSFEADNINLYVVSTISQKFSR